MSESFRPAIPDVEDVLQFDTPENVVFGYQIAGIGSRFLAAVMDTIFIVLLQLVVNLTLIFVAATVGDGSLLELQDSSAVSLLAALFGLVAFVFLWGYYIFFELLWNGQSPGKRLFGLRVIGQSGAPIDVAAALIRNLVRVVDFLPLYYGIGVITMFVDRHARRLGDFAANTLVVYDRGAVTLEQLDRATTQLQRSLQATPLSAPGTPSNPPLHRFEQHYVALARSFISRQHELHNRQEIAALLAEKLRMAMDVPSQPSGYQEDVALLKAVAGRGPAATESD